MAMFVIDNHRIFALRSPCICLLKVYGAPRGAYPKDRHGRAPGTTGDRLRVTVSCPESLLRRSWTHSDCLAWVASGLGAGPPLQGGVKLPETPPVVSERGLTHLAPLMDLVDRRGKILQRAWAWARSAAVVVLSERRCQV